MFVELLFFQIVIRLFAFCLTIVLFEKPVGKDGT